MAQPDAQAVWSAVPESGIEPQSLPTKAMTGEAMTAEAMTAEAIRAARADAPGLRERDLADQLGISEAQLVAAHVGHGVTCIDAHPDRFMPAVIGLGEVTALTRNRSCVHEKVGAYANYHSGAHASMVLTEDIDLRLFPSHWVSAFAVEKVTEKGPQRSLQVFDAAGDAVHKVHLRPTSRLDGWHEALHMIALPQQTDTLNTAPRQPVEKSVSNAAKLEILRHEWARMTDTHQFLRLTSKVGMNRLGAYRIAGAPFVRPLAITAVDQMLTAVAREEVEVMIFTGNRGCIQIHTGALTTLRPMGPWLNVMDPRFNLHLRGDHVAEVWAVEKPTKRGPALSVEAFDAEGSLILQVFGVGKEGRDSRVDWARIVHDLPEVAA